jgi:hypothetical protein
MQANSLPSKPRVEGVMEWVFVIIFGMLFVYALVAWLEVHPSVRVHKPQGMLLLTTGMLLQPLAALLRRRSRVAAYVLLAVSVGFLVAAIRLVAS